MIFAVLKQSYKRHIACNLQLRIKRKSFSAVALVVYDYHFLLKSHINRQTWLQGNMSSVTVIVLPLSAPWLRHMHRRDRPFCSHIKTNKEKYWTLYKKMLVKINGKICKERRTFKMRKFNYCNWYSVINWNAQNTGLPFLTISCRTSRCTLLTKMNQRDCFNNWSQLFRSFVQAYDIQLCDNSYVWGLSQLIVFFLVLCATYINYYRNESRFSDCFK